MIEVKFRCRTCDQQAPYATVVNQDGRPFHFDTLNGAVQHLHEIVAEAKEPHYEFVRR